MSFPPPVLKKQTIFALDIVATSGESCIGDYAGVIAHSPEAG